MIDAAVGTITPLTAVGINPAYTLTDNTADELLTHCHQTATATLWCVVDVGNWKRRQLERQHGYRTASYDQATGMLYADLSRRYTAVRSPVTWRNYLNVGELVPYVDRTPDYGPATYVVVLADPPEFQRAFIEAVKDGTHGELMRQRFERQERVHALREAQPATSRTSGYTNDNPYDYDIPFSGSGHNYAADAPHHLRSYETDDFPLLTWETVRRLRTVLERYAEYDVEAAALLALLGR